MEKAIVYNVENKSIASSVGITPGDVLLSINGHSIKDIFDYNYLCLDEYLIVVIKSKNDDIWEAEIYKEEAEDLGIVFENDLIDAEKSCSNNCMFCFVDQLPKGMRDTMYFKDDDPRLSFLTGNYVTLTNLDQEELERIARLRLSPINISVHTTNPELRVKMLNNRFAGDILEKIEFLADQGIQMSTQIVLCKNINDDKELERTINDLMVFYPHIGSLSIVPVGLSKYRDGLVELEAFNLESSRKVIELIEKYQKIMKEKHGVNFVYIADEFYLLAKKEVPDSKEYDGFPQIENGVGLIASLRDEVFELLNTKKYNNKKRNISIATGESAFEFIKNITYEISKKYDNINISVYKIKNEFFGGIVSVTGLLTGSDLINQLKGKDLKDELLISRSMIKADEDIFLDDITLKECAKELDINIVTVLNTGEDFLNKVTK